jgi:hypothetical protein
MASSQAVAATVKGVSTVDDAVNVIASNHGVSASGTCWRIHSSTAVSTGPDWPLSVSSATITEAANSASRQITAARRRSTCSPHRERCSRSTSRSPKYSATTPSAS